MQTIQLSTDARQTFRTVLGGQSVRITAWWQPLDAHWYISLHWPDRRAIVTGARLVEQGRPLESVVSDFVGSLAVTGAGRPDRHSFGRAHRLVYLAPGETV